MMIELSPTSDIKTVSYELHSTARPFDRFRSAISAGINSHVYPSGVNLFHQGEVPVEIFLVETGLAKLVCSEENGRELIVDIRFSGSLLGLSAAIQNESHSATAVTASPCRLMRISAGRFRDLLGQDTQLGFSVHHLLSAEVINQAARITEIACLTARQRLENFIWRITKQTKPNEPQSSKLQLPLRQWEVAQFLAITPAYLCRLLADLESEEIIVRRNGWIIVSALSSLWHRD
jgi:CRP-like cAMP-binding protein